MVLFTGLVCGHAAIGIINSFSKSIPSGEITFDIELLKIVFLLYFAGTDLIAFLVEGVGVVQQTALLLNNF